GGAATVAANLAALGAAVTLVGVTGRDDAGATLRGALAALGVETDRLVADAGSRTHCKQRILASGQYVVRVDDGRTAASARRVREAGDSALAGAEIGVPSDYDLGAFESGLIGFPAPRRPAAPGRRRPNRP